MTFTLSDIAKRINLPGTRVSCSLAGYDDAPIAGCLCPTLTHLRQPVAPGDEPAVTMPMDLMHGRKLRPARALLEPQLIARDSTIPSHVELSLTRNG